MILVPDGTKLVANDSIRISLYVINSSATVGIIVISPIVILYITFAVGNSFALGNADGLFDGSSEGVNDGIIDGENEGAASVHSPHA